MEPPIEASRSQSRGPPDLKTASRPEQDRNLHSKLPKASKLAKMTKLKLHSLALISALIFLVAETISSYAIDSGPLSSQSVGGGSSDGLPPLPPPPPSPPASVSSVQQLAPSEGRRDHRRPIWALAHMVNSIKELDYRLAKGANAVEADVTFGREGDPLFTYHGPPCDCWRHCHQQEDFNEYLSYVREVAIEQPMGIGQNLSLLLLDLKLSPLDQLTKARAGQMLAKSILVNLFPSSNEAAFHNQLKQKAGPRFNLVLSVNHVTDIELIHNFIHYLEINNSTHLLDQIGFDVGMNDELQQIDSLWRRYGKGLNLWQGDGYTNCLSPFYNLQRLTKALARRDNPAGYPSKVYHWTIDIHDRMRESLQLGVDAIMTNHPERLLTVLHEPEITHDCRLANRYDEPFRKIIRRGSVGKGGEMARYQRSASTTSGGFMGSLMDVISSWLAYIREIPFLSYPTTSKLLSRASSANRRQKPVESQTAISLVRLQNQPEYRVDVANETSNNGSSIMFGPEQPIKQLEPYEGPKWYTSVVSNVLVSLMRSILPAQ